MLSPRLPAGHFKNLVVLCSLAALLTSARISHAQGNRTVTGKVTDEDGRPIPGATIGLWVKTSPFGDEGIPQDQCVPDTILHADAEGKWSVSLPPGRFWPLISAVARGYSLATREPKARDEEDEEEGGDKATLNFVLLPTRPLHFNLVDWNNRPIPGGTIKFVDRKQGDQGGDSPIFGGAYGASMENMVPPVQTNAEGQAVLPFASEGDKLTISVSHKSFQSVELTMDVPSEDGLKVRLLPGAGVQGRLVDAGGKPLAGRWVGLNEGGQVVRTGEDGTFEIRGRAPSFAVLDIVGDDLIIPIKQLETKRGEIKDVKDVIATPGALFTATATDKKTGRPVTSGLIADISLVSPSGLPVRWKRSPRYAKNGALQFRLPPGEFKLTLRCQPLNASKSETIKIEDERPVTMNAVLEQNAPPQPMLPPWLRNQPRSVVTAPPPGAAQEPAPPDYIYGKVTNPDGGPAAGVTVSVMQNGQVIREVKSNAEGKFALGPLSGDIGPNGKATGLIRGEAGKPAPRILLRAATPNFTPGWVVVDPADEAPLNVQLGALSPLRLRVVTSDGKPVPGATITPEGLRLFSGDDNNPWPTASPGAPTSLPGTAQTDARGEVVFPNLPAEGLCSFRVARAGFGEITYVVALPRRDSPELTVLREGVVEGRVLLGDEILNSKELGVNVQSTGPSKLKRIAALDANGHYSVGTLPPSNQLNEGRLAINLNLSKDSVEIAPGLTASWVVPGLNGDVVLDDTRNGGIQRWICFADLLPKIAEGEHITYDFKAVRMIKVSGKVLPGDDDKPVPKDYVVARQQPVSRRALGYEAQSVPLNPDNTFEIWVPAGEEVALEVRSKDDRWGDKVTVAELGMIALGETRHVEIKLKPVSKVFRASFRTFNYHVRVLGPDKATVPLTKLTYLEPELDAIEGTTAIDGILTVITAKEMKGGEVTISSPLLNAPVKVKPVKDVTQTIRLDRLPPEVPASTPRYSIDNNTQVPAPARLGIGEEVPGFLEARWIYGNPMHREDLKGKITLCVAQVGALRPLLDVIERHRDKMAVVLFTENADGPESFINNVSFGGTPAEEAALKARIKAAVSAVGVDPPTDQFSSANVYRLRAKFAPAVIGPDGQLAATGLQTRDLVAKIEQLAAEMGAK